ncbi:MAG: PHB depolymerase family esterase [Pseudomonadota bacterium]
MPPVLRDLLDHHLPGLVPETPDSYEPRIGDPPIPAGAIWERCQGALPYRLFRPARPRWRAPLIVMLHGCTQNPEDFARSTGMNEAADKVGAHVLWPEQTRRANASACWNWFDIAHQGRTGEAAAIAITIREVLGRIGHFRKVHVAGLSAGGGMAAILAARYGDLISAVGIHSGLPVGSASCHRSAMRVMRKGGTGQVELAVPAIVFHGSEDKIVHPSNAAALLPGTTERSVSTYGERIVRVSVRRRSGQRRASELWQIEGLGHAWSGGTAAMSHADPEGPDATAEMMRFFSSV